MRHIINQHKDEGINVSAARKFILPSNNQKVTTCMIIAQFTKKKLMKKVGLPIVMRNHEKYMHFQ